MEGGWTRTCGEFAHAGVAEVTGPDGGTGSNGAEAAVRLPLARLVMNR